MSTASTMLWVPDHAAAAFQPADIAAAVEQVRAPATVVEDPATGARGLGLGGALIPAAPGAQGWPVLGHLPGLYPEWLGSRAFTEVHSVRFPYVQGSMANGIATARMVVEMGRAGFLGFFGAAGLDPDRIRPEIDTLEAGLGAQGLPFGCNLIHNPHEPAFEAAVVDLYVQRGVRKVSASAFMGLTAPVVRYAFTGVRQGPDGEVHRPNALFAKISRPEVARRFMEPPPPELLEKLVAAGQLTADEARLARHLPVAEDYMVESDSGGHTDNRPLAALFPSIRLLRDEVVAQRGYARPIRLGAAGGLGTPEAVAAAFALGADFVLTGSVNQACVESGLSEAGRKLLAQAGLADVMMAPAADMFEMGVEVQVLRRGTMFGVRAQKLYELYRMHPGLDALPARDRAEVEKMLRSSLEDAWTSTRAYWAARDPREADKGDRDPKHRMALVFRAYLGQASRWAIAGVPDRLIDYQIWCGPAMGAFNAWAAGSFLAEPAQRTVVQVARNLMEGAAVVTRAGQLRALGLPVPAAAFAFRPRPLA